MSAWKEVLRTRLESPLIFVGVVECSVFQQLAGLGGQLVTFASIAGHRLGRPLHVSIRAVFARHSRATVAAGRRAGAPDTEGRRPARGPGRTARPADSEEELLQKVWPNTFVEEANLSYNIFALRKALGDTAENPSFIETVPKRGYRFKAPVTPVRRASSLDMEEGKAKSGPHPILVFPEQPARQFEGTAVLKTAIEPLAPGPRSMHAQASWRSSPLASRWMILAAALALVAVSYPAWRWWRASLDVAPPRALPLTAVRGVVHSPSLSPDGNYVVFTWSGPNRDNFNIYVQQIGAGSPRPLTTDPNNDHGPSWSPDGLKVVFLRRRSGTGSSEVWQIPPVGGTERKLADLHPRLAPFRPEAPGWCPDSSCVLVTDSPGADQMDAVFAIAIDSGERRQLTFPERGSGYGCRDLSRRPLPDFSSRHHAVQRQVLSRLVECPLRTRGRTGTSDACAQRGQGGLDARQPRSPVRLARLALATGRRSRRRAEESGIRR